MGTVSLAAVILVTSMVALAINERMKYIGLDEVCFQREKARYCNAMGMELGSVIITPSGLFGGSPYNKDACVLGNSQMIIDIDDLDVKRCRG